MKVSMFGYIWQSMILPGKYATLWGNLFSVMLIYHLIDKKRGVNGIFVGLLLGLLLITKVDYFLASFVAITFFTHLNFRIFHKTFLSTIFKYVLGLIIPVIPFLVYLMHFNKISIDTLQNNILPSYSSSFWFNNRSFYNVSMYIQSLIINFSVIIYLLIISLDKIGKFIISKAVKVLITLLFIIILNYTYVPELYLFGFYQSLYLLSIIAILLMIFLIPKSLSRYWPIALIIIFESVLNLRNKLAVSAVDFIYLLIAILASLLTVSNFKRGMFHLNNNLMVVGITVILTILCVKEIQYLNLAQFSGLNKTIITDNGNFITQDKSTNDILLQTTDYIKNSLEGAKTLTAFPMEASINYFSGLPNLTYYDQYVNGIISPSDEYKVIENLQEKMPDVITVSNYDFIGIFGMDYYKNIYNWINSNYSKVANFGCLSQFEPSSCTGYGIQVLSHVKNEKI